MRRKKNHIKNLFVGKELLCPEKKKKTRAAFFSFVRLLLFKTWFQKYIRENVVFKRRILFFKIFFIYKYIKIIIFYYLILMHQSNFKILKNILI
jgi:hypothetical protein